MKYFFCLICINAFLSVQSQEKETAEFLLEGPTDWRKEIISLPLSFAPELEYSGTEYVLFAKGWSDKNATDFWTYTFAWTLDESPEFTETKLNKDLKNYFDGLMKVVGGDNVPKDMEEATVATLKNVKSKKSFEGQVRIFDAFFLKDTIELNVQVLPTYCKKRKKHIIYFRYSPKSFDTPLWKTMNAITISCK